MPGGAGGREVNVEAGPGEPVHGVGCPLGQGQGNILNMRPLVAQVGEEPDFVRGPQGVRKASENTSIQPKWDASRRSWRSRPGLLSTWLRRLSRCSGGHSKSEFHPPLPPFVSEGGLQALADGPSHPLDIQLVGFGEEHKPVSGQLTPLNRRPSPVVPAWIL